MHRAVDLYPYVKANLRKRYPYDDGWIIRKLDREKNNPDFVVDRRRKGFVERAVVEVVPECEITEEHIKKLYEFAEKLKEEGVEIIAKILVICRGSNTNIVPEDIEVMVLRSCECNQT